MALVHNTLCKGKQVRVTGRPHDTKLANIEHLGADPVGPWSVLSHKICAQAPDCSLQRSISRTALWLDRNELVLTRIKNTRYLLLLTFIHQIKNVNIFTSLLLLH